MIRDELFYDYESNREQILLGSFLISPGIGILYYHKLLAKKSYRRSGGIWEEISNREYYYSHSTTTSLVERESLSFKIFPNPASSTLQIITRNEMDIDILLYGINGNLIKQKSIPSNETLDISKLIPGIYQIKVLGKDGAIGIEKFIKL